MALTSEQFEKLQMPKNLQSIEGSPSEVLAVKAALISKFGFPAYEQCVLRSQRSYNAGKS